jgi:hypothetical protein
LSFLDISPGLLAKRAAKEMSKRPEMRRYGVAFAPLARGYSEGISRAAARQGSIKKGLETMKEN